MQIIGFSIYRTKKIKPIVFKENDRPILLEFVGISGVGKSTLFHELKKHKKLWIEVREFMQMNRAANTNTILDDNVIYQEIADSKLHSVLQQQMAPADRFRVIHWGYTTLIEDAVISSLNINSTIVSEEGLLHNFGDCIEQLHHINKFKFNEIIQKRAVIYCFTSPEIIAKQIENRKLETGRIIAHHKNKSFDELLVIHKRELEEKERFINLLEKNNVPIIMINTSDELQGNVLKINTFIEKLQSGKYDGL